MSSPSAQPPLSSSPKPPYSKVADEYADPGARSIDLSQRPVADSLREIMASSPRLIRDQPPPLPAGPAVWSNRHWTLALTGVAAWILAFGLAAQAVWKVGTRGLERMSSAPDSSSVPAHLLILRPAAVAFLLIVGIGLVLARRWARHLSLAALATALLGLLVTAVSLGANNWLRWEERVSEAVGGPAWMYLAVAGFSAVVAWIFLAVLSHRDVRLTCEAAQPTPDWTDRRSPSELMLVVMMLGGGVAALTLATHQPWPRWGEWQPEHAAVVWCGAAAMAWVAGMLVAAGRAFGGILALMLSAMAGSSIIMTVLKQPADTMTGLWGGRGFEERGGLVFSCAATAVVLTVAAAAIRAAVHRKRSDRIAANDQPSLN